MPHARCSPRSGPRGLTSHAAQDPAHLSTMWPSGDICRRSSVGRARSVPGADSRRWFESNRLHHRRDLLPRSRTERKPAEVVLPVRCMKAAGRSNYYLAGPGLCKRNGCDRHTGAGLKSSVGYRHCYTLRECRGVQWMWRGGGNRMIRPLCKQLKQSAMPGPCEKNNAHCGRRCSPSGRVKSAM